MILTCHLKTTLGLCHCYQDKAFLSQNVQRDYEKPNGCTQCAELTVANGHICPSCEDMQAAAVLKLGGAHQV